MSEPTVAWRLFNELFMVNIQNKFLWTDDHRKRLPGWSSHDPDTNQMLLNSVTTVARTPVALILLFDKGIVAEFQNRNDIYIVHDLITRHLNRWGEIISNPLSGRHPPPEEDLYKMDMFAEHIAADANFHRATLEAQGRLTQKSDFISELLRAFGGSQRHNSRLGRVTEENSVADITNVIVPGNSIRDAWDNSAWGMINGNSRHSG